MNYTAEPAQPADSGRVAAALRGLLEIGKRDTTNPKYDWYWNEARAALAAQGQSAPPAWVPDGWVMVPREPTIEMLVAANAAWFIPDPSPFNKGDEARLEVWKAMLAAAPPASGDWGKVREVAADIRRCAGNNNANFHLSWADKLAAALPENTRG